MSNARISKAGEKPFVRPGKGRERIGLRTLRVAHEKTQADVAEAAQMDQGDVSRLEARADVDDIKISTLRRYVEALGGTLEIAAVIDGRRALLAV